MQLSFLVERARELDALATASQAAREGRGAVVTISGEPGIGKTRLADEASHHARALGMLVAWGRVWEAGGAPAFWPWVQIARALGRAGFDLPPSLSRIVPEHAMPAPPLALGADRFALFDAMLSHLRAAAAHTPLFLVLDDLHAADAASLALADFLAPALLDLPIVLVATYRDVEARLLPGQGDVLARLACGQCALRPSRLSRTAVAELVGAVADRDRSPALAQAEVDVLYRMSEGNPLYVGELLRVIRSPAQGRSSADAGTAGANLTMPDGMRAAIRAHLGHLPESLRGPLEVAAVLGREFTATALAALLEPALDLDVVVARLTEAASAGVVAEPAPMRFAFAHGLFREVLYADLGARRLAMHRRVAETLERIHADNPAAPVAEIARHWLAAGPATAQRARDMARRAAERASAALAHEEAALLLERALSAHEQAEPANDTLRVELLIELAEAQTRSGDIARGKRTSTLAANLARDLDAAPALARAALAHGASISPGFVDRELVLLLEEARARLLAENERALSAADPGCCASAVCTPTAGLQARILARLAAAKQPAPDPRGPLLLAREALTLLPEVCSDVRLSVLHAAIGAMMDVAHPLERRPLNEEAAHIAKALGEREILLRTLVRLVFDHADAGDLAGARERIAEVDALARQFPRPSARVPGALARSMLALLRGDHAEHEANFEQAMRLAEGEPSFLSVLQMHRLGAARMCERNDELARDRDEFVASLAPWSNYAAAFDASIAARRGDVRAASAALARLDRTHLRTCMDTYLLNWVAEGAALAKDAELGALLEAALAVHEGEWVSVSLPGFIIEGPVSGSRALAALARGARDDSERFRREALDEARRAGADAVVARLSRALPGEAGAPAAVFEVCAPAPSAAFEREGEYWTVSGEGGVVRLKDSRGLAMLARLVSEPGLEIAALDLETASLLPIDAGDSGELLDEQARTHYRRRLLELEAEIDEAEAWNDQARAIRARSESEALRTELSRAVGLDGRVRRAGRAAERARVNVQRRITDAIQRIEKHHAALGRHLSRAVRTGAYVSYLPARARRGGA